MTISNEETEVTILAQSHRAKRGCSRIIESGKHALNHSAFLTLN